MKSKFGIFLMVVGTLLVAAALALVLFNTREQVQAEEAVNELMPLLVEAINERQETAQTEPTAANPAVDDREMTVVKVKGYDCIGFVAIPALELELPVISEWSYSRLKVSPCRFTGTTYANNLVVMAHNYPRHFGKLSELSVGDTVTFTDMDGVQITYEVVALDILDPTAVEEMIAGDYDLTLFTCTYGGKTRVTVRCDRVEE